MKRRRAAPLLLAAMLSSVTALPVRRACAGDGRVATVLDGRRLFFDEQTRRRIDAAQQDGSQTLSRAPEPTTPTVREQGADDHDDAAAGGGGGGQATVDGRLGRQRIVDGVPLRSEGSSR